MLSKKLKHNFTTTTSKKIQNHYVFIRGLEIYNKKKQIPQNSEEREGEKSPKWIKKGG